MIVDNLQEIRILRMHFYDILDSASLSFSIFQTIRNISPVDDLPNVLDVIRANIFVLLLLVPLELPKYLHYYQILTSR